MAGLKKLFSLFPIGFSARRTEALEHAPSWKFSKERPPAIKHQHRHIQDFEWIIEFYQIYDDGFEVTKRGLDAAPMVIKKFNLVKNEVIAFTSYQYANKSLTAFHFHPDFSNEDRREYMRKHEDGHELAVNKGSRLAARHAQFWQMMEESISGWVAILLWSCKWRRISS